MNLYHLQVFQAVARRLSYSRAAEDLFVSQPAVSRHVHSLEKELGVVLFQQIGNRVQLTQAGQLVYDYSQKLFAAEEEMKRGLTELENLDRGYLRLGASSTPGNYLLPPLVASFRRQHPAVEVNLVISSCSQVVASVLSYELDLGFLGGTPSHPDLEVRPFGHDRMVLIVSNSHPFGRLSSIRPELLASESFVLREAGSCTRRALEDELLPRRILLHRAMELNGSEAVKRSVAAGMGVAVVSQHSVVEELRRGELHALRVEGLHLEREMSIVSRKDVHTSATARAFIPLAERSRPSLGG